MDLIKMFEGLTPDEAKELTARIEKAVEREYQTFRNGEQPMDNFEELSRRLEALTQQVKDAQEIETYLRERETQAAFERNREYWSTYNGQPKSEAAPDPAATEAHLASLTREYQQLMKNATRNAPELASLGKKIEQLKVTQQQEEARVKAARQLAAKPELDALAADRETLSARYMELIKNASQNGPELAQLEAQLQAREQRAQAIESGDEGITLKWSGGAV